MSGSTMRRRSFAVGAIALAATAVAAQAPAAAQNVVRCPIGYVCLQPADAPSTRLVLVREGDRRDFPGGLKVSSVANQTRLNYCVTGRPISYGLPPGQEFVRPHVVLAVAPSRVCVTATKI